MIAHLSCSKEVKHSDFALLRYNAAVVDTYRRFGTSYQMSALTLADGTVGLFRNVGS